MRHPAFRLPQGAPMTDRPARADPSSPRFDAAGRQEADAAPGARGAADIIYLPDERQRRKKATSGSEKRQRSKAIRVRVLPAEMERLKAEAAAARMSVAGYLASGRLGEEKAQRSRVTRRRATVDVSALMDALIAFNRAGNNQNQIARALNELLLVAHEQSNARLASEVEALAEAIRGLPVLFAEPVAAIMAALHRGDLEP